MMRPIEAARDAADAIRTERYLHALLAADVRHTAAIPTDMRVDPAIRLAARRLRADLVHVHPSFRFQEDLAARLAVVAGRLRDGLPVDGDAAEPGFGGRLATFPYPAIDATDGALVAAGPGRARVARPLIVGGVASAAISIGAVYVAWRFSHPSEGAMTRAVRAAHAATAAAQAAAQAAAAHAAAATKVAS